MTLIISLFHQFAIDQLTSPSGAGWVSDVWLSCVFHLWQCRRRGRWPWPHPPDAVHARPAIRRAVSGPAHGHTVCHHYQPGRQETTQPGQDHLHLLPQEVGVAELKLQLSLSSFFTSLSSDIFSLSQNKW